MTRIWLLCVWLGLPAVSATACQVEARATIPLAVGARAVTVAVEINGQTATFILDTGAERSVVSPEAVQRLNLARDQWVGTTMSGVGGIDRRPNADPRSFSLGGVKLMRQTLSHDTSLTVADLPRPQIGDRLIDGLLGRDYLAPYDLDLDLPDRTLTLYHVQACSGRFLPWTAGYASVPVTIPLSHALVLPVILDGKPLSALLDTGASASLLAAPGMFRMGLDAASLQGDPSEEMHGVGPRMVAIHQHVFRTLQVGAVESGKPTIWVAPIRLNPIVDMLLGEDWLEGRRIWVSWTTQQLFVARP